MTLTEYLEEELSRKPKWHDFITLSKTVCMCVDVDKITDEDFRKMQILHTFGYRFYGFAH